MPNDFAIQALETCQALKAQIEVTTRCNFRCGHCYNFDRHAPGVKGNPGLSTDKWKDIIRQVSELGIIELTFTGGEATLRSDLVELINYATAQHLIVNLRTNGSLLNPNRLADYAKAGLQDLEVTLYGFSAESHDRFTGFKGAFDQTIESLEYLKKHHPQLRTFINISVLAHNFHEVQLREQLEERLSTKIRSNLVCHGRNDLSLDAQEHAVPLNEHLKLRPVSNNELKLLDSPESGDASAFRCGCARIQCFITAEGKVTPCAEVPWEAGDLKTASLRDIWENSEVFTEIRGLQSQDWKTCHGCPLTKVCGRRNCSAYKYNGNYTDFDPAHGAITYGRFKPHGVSKPPCLAEDTSAT